MRLRKLSSDAPTNVRYRSGSSPSAAERFTSWWSAVSADSMSHRWRRWPGRSRHARLVRWRHGRERDHVSAHQCVGGVDAADADRDVRALWEIEGHDLPMRTPDAVASVESTMRVRGGDRGRGSRHHRQRQHAPRLAGSMARYPASSLDDHRRTGPRSHPEGSVLLQRLRRCVLKSGPCVTR